MVKKKDEKSILVLSTLSMIIAFSVWSILSPVAGKIQEMYGLTGLQKSILIATPVLLGSVMRIPIGILADRLGGRRVYVFTMLFLTLPLIGASFTSSYEGLLLCAFFIGMAGTTFAVSIAYVSGSYPPEKQGLILGIAGMGNLGTAVASFLAPQIVNLWGLPWMFRIFALAILIMSLIFWFGTVENGKANNRKKLKHSLDVMKNKETWVLSGYYFLTFGGFVTFGIYLPILFQELHQLDAVQAGSLTGIFVIGATLIRPVGGYLSDKFGAVKVLNIVFSTILLTSVLMALWQGNVLLFMVACLMMAIMLGTGNGAVFKRVAEVSRGNIGAVTGVVGAAGGLGGFFPPILLGIFMDYLGEYTLGFVLLSLFALVCLVYNSDRIRAILTTKKQGRVSSLS
ncbi:MFS transporter, NNP family, nitrate/nitrite transporter [Mesobacillus persicus]|uniref:MFS transporter, NNP family, nitrate/nitrite transporter n=1 Tax=Mesobacillus persicus TaxID=930146 RepID=A0A1H8D7N2_9BACI|nr:MFS transporter [Mesobacillus persicus]SEN02804.1 MFS transporter, NNP family, nitrate/nitrite transporter [Mesobacillus persicus]